MGVEVKVENLTKRFGKQTIWEDVSLTLPPVRSRCCSAPPVPASRCSSSISSGCSSPTTATSGSTATTSATSPSASSTRSASCSASCSRTARSSARRTSTTTSLSRCASTPRRARPRSRRSSSTRWSWSVCPAPRPSCRARSPAVCASAPASPARWCSTREILLFDEPDSGLDPVRTSYLDQLIVDLNAQTGATCLIVTHNINTARTVPDNIGLLYRRHLAMFGPREMLLTSEEPVVLQFMNGRKQGPDRHVGGEGRRRARRRGRGRRRRLPSCPDIEPQMLPSVAAGPPVDGLPHGSHAFLRDHARRADIPFGASFR